RFRLLSPLHIGHQKIGNIQRTRHYVPARVLWGALTARLTRNPLARRLADVSEGDYITMGELVKRQLAFSYFFPTDENLNPVYPAYDEQGLKYVGGQSCLTPETFAWRYLGSYAATALNYERNAVEDASLHEVEFLSPHSRFDNASHPVYLLGYAIAAAGCKLPWPILKAALQEIQIGGERRYGWGRLRLDKAEEHGQGEAALFGQLHCDAKTEARPKVLTGDNATLFAHTAVSGITACGEIEPLVGRVWEQSRGAGQTVEFTDMCYVPGAKLKDSQTFEMTATHIWQAKPRQP
ncbi:MAG: hypothetical protein L0Z53_27710, partial [Acidobacteriales bacterium]|nr:hypothetical protein [Terriglobales bacterium]